MRRIYAPVGKIAETGVRRRAEIYYQQLDALRSLRQHVRRDLLAESGKHSAMKLLRQIPSIGPIRAALLIALMQTPHRFRTKRQPWAYSGLGLKTSTSGEYRFVEGQLKRSRKFLAIRGLNANHNHDLKNIFKGAATRAAAVPGVSRRSSVQRDETNDGASHLGAQDRGHHFVGLEERSPFRRRISETASSLSVRGESIARFISNDGRLVLQTLWFEGEYP
jgi:transposase IS116/IS110/IS902 family protein